MQRPREMRSPGVGVQPLAAPQEGGFTMIEVMVAAFVITVGILGLIAGFDSARKLTLLSERRTATAHRAQLELERLQTVEYAKLALNAAPTHSAETANPNYYVQAGGSEYQWEQSNGQSSNSTNTDKLITEATGSSSREPRPRPVRPHPKPRGRTPAHGAPHS